MLLSLLREYIWLPHRMQSFKIDDLVRLCQKEFYIFIINFIWPTFLTILATFESTGSYNVQFWIWVAVTVASSKCWINSTSSAGVGTFEGTSEGTSDIGNLLHYYVLMLNGTPRCTLIKLVWGPSAKSYWKSALVATVCCLPVMTEVVYAELPVKSDVHINIT